MKYNEITVGRFLSRPNRFVARVEIQGREEIVHVKNTGRCKELLLPGAEVCLERSSNPNRKTAYDLVAVYKEGLGLVNMDSQAANAVAGEWLRRQMEQTAEEPIGYFQRITMIRPEYVWGESRIDFYFEMGEQKCLMEVKGVTLERDGIAYFPDAPTERGVKHIRELIKAKKQGYDCYLAFVIQMPGILRLRPNNETHPAFGAALQEALDAGVKVLALGCEILPDSLRVADMREITDLTEG